MRSTKFTPQAENLEPKVSLSASPLDTPIPFPPETPPVIMGPQQPIAPPGLGNPGTTTNPPTPTSPSTIETIVNGAIFLLPPVGTWQLPGWIVQKGTSQ
jgi:hypothetical protein